MNKKNSFLICILSILCFIDATAFEFDANYTNSIEKILYYKKGPFAVYYGGPIDRANGGVSWLMTCTFQDETFKIRAVYEIAFVNCTLSNCQEAEVVYIDVSDVDIKFKNTLVKDYSVLSHLLNGKYKKGKYIVVRGSDVANIYYPLIYNHSIYGERREFDKETIIKFLRSEFKTSNCMFTYYRGESKDEIDFETEDQVSYKPIPVNIELEDKNEMFYIVKKYVHDDEWKLYYLISKQIIKNQSAENSHPLVRIDSGCVSGQIYDDDSCDCLDQLHDGLLQLAKEKDEMSIIIHIPAHDGRGFGTVPKAETEIYKRGGCGRVHKTHPLNTVESAKLLYANGKYDIRTYDGAARILKSMGVEKVTLLTDNALKVEALKKHDIEVVRKKTDTQKVTCIDHINSKKNSEFYYKN